MSVENRRTAEGLSGQGHRLLPEAMAEVDALSGRRSTEHRQQPGGARHKAVRHRA